jgi:hypothetical protein
VLFSVGGGAREGIRMKLSIDHSRKHARFE